MTKRAKSNLRRPGVGAAGYRTVVVDCLQVGSSHGNLTLRVGRTDSRPVCIALPAENLPSFLTTLHHACMDAEEEYWNVVRSVAPTAPSSTAADVSRTLQKWLLSQNWTRLLSAVPEDHAHSLPLLTHAGHIGFRLAPPFTTARALAIFDPLQLRRVQPAVRQHCAVAQRQAASSPLHPRAAIALAVDQLSAQPWPPAGVPDPSPQEAARYMQAGYEAFQRRSPYLRSPENTLDLAPDDS